MLDARFARPVTLEDRLVHFRRAVRLPQFQYRSSAVGRFIVLDLLDTQGWKVTAHAGGGLDIEGPRPVPWWLAMISESMSRNSEAYWADQDSTGELIP